MEKTSEHKAIWTIGHSTHPLKDFISMLQSFEIQMLVEGIPNAAFSYKEIFTLLLAFAGHNNRT